ncbi:glycosyltransferase family 2 protein [Rhodospira trueperi]|uniref:Dolichol-phosphate mannosyltransferase n=1 Tax=Rhodospira trueperi TaxID=69960 RepID=A0A1G7GQJ0_9PROT|nr:glycosyltransferase family 2 protein [Rhodospira trueperi]SDE90249.1 dolichol-phosphate mannosyltransferase [Rhodospira trueperi]
MTERPDVSIVIAFHNERDSLPQLLDELKAALTDFPLTCETLLVDDASTDDGADMVERFAASHEGFRLLRLARRGGQTECYRSAFAAAHAPYIIRMDADLQDSPADLVKFVEPMREGADLVMGLRECRRHRRLLRLASAVYDIMIMLIFDTPLHSNSGSYVCFRTALVKDVPFRKNDHRYLPLIAMRRGEGHVREVLVRHRSRRYGESKYRPFKKLLLGLPEVIRFLFRLKRGYYDLVRTPSGSSARSIR